MADSTSGGDAIDRVQSYTVGLALSILLTLSAFGLVRYSNAFPAWTVRMAIVAAAALQMIVHLFFFMHLRKSAGGRWSVVSLVFTLLILFLFAGGTLWIMSNLDYRMM